MTSEDFTWYEVLCLELDRLELEFQSFAHEKHSLFAGLFDVYLGSDRLIKVEDWQAFQSTAEGRVGKGGWEEWEHHPNDFGGCYFGNAESLPRFRQLATSGILILSSIDWGASKGKPTPSGYNLDLPATTSDADWVRLVFDSANLGTAFMRFDQYHIWDLSNSDSWDDFKEEDLWVTNKSGCCFPRHPVYRALHMDLFFSSAEAIRLWRHRVNAVVVDGLINDEVVSLPAPDYDFDEESVDFSLPFSQSPIHAAEMDVDRPKWDGRVLTGRDNRCIKSYSSKAMRMIPVLDAFERAGWPKELSDPFGLRQKSEEISKAGRNPKHEIEGYNAQRRETIRNLNATQNQIDFECVGDRFGVSWMWRQQAGDLEQNTEM